MPTLWRVKMARGRVLASRIGLRGYLCLPIWRKWALAWNAVGDTTLYFAFSGLLRTPLELMLPTPPDYLTQTRSCEIVDAMTRWSTAAEGLRAQLPAGSIARKADGSVVTAVDIAIQVLMLELLRAFDPSPTLAEENADSLAALPGGIAAVMEIIRVIEPTSTLRSDEVLAALVQSPARGTEDRFWILDPVDGTRSFTTSGHWCICLALVEHGNLVFAVNALPTVGEGVVQIAQRGKGAAERALCDAMWHPLHVRATSNERVRIASAPNTSAKWRERVEVAAAREGLALEWKHAESQAKYALVARGDADAVLTPCAVSPAALWDHAGGALIAVEAGARAQSFDGSPLQWSIGRDVGAVEGIAVGVEEAMRVARAIERRTTELPR